MTPTVPHLTASLLPVDHAFFTREGGVSIAPYDTLNSGWNTADSPEALCENWQRFARHLAVRPEHMLSVEQVHGADVYYVDDGTPLWSLSNRPEADALVSTRADIAISVSTADCAPVLLSSFDGQVVGAAHAGWRGAVGGVLEATVQTMKEHGATAIKAVIGPCIGPDSYEISTGMKDDILAQHPGAKRFFPVSMRPRDGHAFFDLPGFCQWRLEQCGDVHVTALHVDTRRDARFFSHRQATLEGCSKTGRQLSAIRAFSTAVR